MTPIENRGRTPLGAFGRTPLEVFGRAVAGTPPATPTVLGFTVRKAYQIGGGALGSTNEYYEWAGVTSPWPGPCGVFRTTFGLGGRRGYIFSQINVTGHTGGPADNFAPELLFDYTFIGDDSGGRWKPTDVFTQIGCIAWNPNPSQFGLAAKWPGTTPVPFSYPAIQEPGCEVRSTNPLQPAPGQSTTILVTSEIGATTGHPLNLNGVTGPPNSGSQETFVGYPPGSVPP